MPKRKEPKTPEQRALFDLIKLKEKELLELKSKLETPYKRTDEEKIINYRLRNSEPEDLSYMPLIDETIDEYIERVVTPIVSSNKSYYYKRSRAICWMDSYSRYPHSFYYINCLAHTADPLVKNTVFYRNYLKSIDEIK